MGNYIWVDDFLGQDIWDDDFWGDEFGVMTFGLIISRVMLLGVTGVIFGAIFLMFCFGDCLDNF